MNAPLNGEYTRCKAKNVFTNKHTSTLHFLGLGGLLHRLVGLPSRSGELLGLVDGDDIGERLLGSQSALRVGGLHDLHLHSQHTLLHEDVTHSHIDELLAGVTGLDHVSLLELHGVGTLLTQLSRHNDLATLRSSLQSAADHSVRRTTHGKTGQKLVLESLRLNLRAQTALHHTLSVQNDVVLVEAESAHQLSTTPLPLLDQGRQLVDATGVLANDLLRSGGTDDDLRLHGGLAHADSGVADLGQLAVEELGRSDLFRTIYLVELGVEHSIGHTLVLLAHSLSRHSSRANNPSFMTLAWSGSSARSVWGGLLYHGNHSPRVSHQNGENGENGENENSGESECVEETAECLKMDYDGRDTLASLVVSSGVTAFLSSRSGMSLFSKGE